MDMDLENMLCFSVYAASREITRLYRPILDKFDLTYPQYLVLVVLWKHRNTTVTALGDKLLLDTGTLTPLLKRLQEAELITRKRSIDDERKVEIGLTDKGAALEAQMKDVSRNLFVALCKSEENYVQTLSAVQGLLKEAQLLSGRD
ncbi:MarR family winged helix-turn-helix transcriptional regulator [Paenibacillus sacheonensis]|uniref:MarR family transcriptional regulator n=1 Tax=Paenibacillus sacheonensis TaxID=742054 RepID=A0A7X4YQ89_9BACL|nr:MarR family transcriptional regulator [Paenibacillus sacheonensis]MBM7566353.1 DNA-binding MarR family transcriptional regulator [Paenibacillus sacheonensis]NBC70556.1 MarR family transcriptional regulator [Paenibacillus sacheonensis]